MFRRPLNAYRSTGADPPFTDPAGAHGTAMEGYYRRLVDAEAGSGSWCPAVFAGDQTDRGQPWH